MAATFPFHSLRGSVWWWGKRGSPGAGKDYWVWWSPTPGSASFPGPQVLLLLAGVSTASRPPRRLPTQILQVASVNLDLIDSQLDEQDVADDTCVVVASPSVAGRVIPLRRGWTTVIHIRASLQGPACTSMGSRNQLQEGAVCNRSKSSAHTSPICWRKEPRRRAALCDHGNSYFLFCSREPARFPHSLFHMAPDVALARIRLTLCQALHWNVELSTLEAHFGDRLRCTGSTDPGPEVVSSRCKDTTRFGRVHLQSSALRLSHQLRHQPALQPLSPPTGAKTLPLRGHRLWDLARRGVPDNAQAVVGTATLTRAVDLAGTGMSKGRQGTPESRTSDWMSSNMQYSVSRQPLGDATLKEHQKQRKDAIEGAERWDLEAKAASLRWTSTDADGDAER